MNIIKNPEFVFDINKSEVVDASLSTIAQTFIDSCAMTEPDFGMVSAPTATTRLEWSPVMTECPIFFNARRRILSTRLI